MPKPPTETQIVQALDELAALRERLAVTEGERERLIARQSKIAALTAEISALTDAVGELDAFIRAGVLAAEKTVKGEQLMAVFNQGRSTWDGKRLDGYAAAHPEILDFKKVGSPTVSIRGA